MSNDKNDFFLHSNEVNHIAKEDYDKIELSYSQPATAKLLICRKKTSFGVSKFSFLRGLRLILC